MISAYAISFYECRSISLLHQPYFNTDMRNEQNYRKILINPTKCGIYGVMVVVVPWTVWQSLEKHNLFTFISSPEMNWIPIVSKRQLN